jgi:putative flippase GtrA
MIWFILFFNKINYLILSSLGFITGIFGGYYFNKNWTYKEKNNKSKKILSRYFLLYLISFLISLIFLKITFDHLDF